MASAAPSTVSYQTVIPLHPDNHQTSPVLKDLAQSLDKAHGALSDIATAPFLGTQQALDQTNLLLQSTAKNLSDSTQNLVKFQTNLQALVNRIKDAREFLPADDSESNLGTGTL
ncbi:hypothetical protein BGX34_001993 [Mortierella sp. NVP85]|nr:hypothetical protein BGX34_001993 [Mortierella sp. NVP85]